MTAARTPPQWLLLCIAGLTPEQSGQAAAFGRLYAGVEHAATTRGGLLNVAASRGAGGVSKPGVDHALRHAALDGT
jgi:hypothetical protein